VGDAVMATPVLGALRRAWPRARVHVLARAWAAPVWERQPGVEQVIVLDAPGQGLGRWWRLVRRLRRERYDLALVLPNSFAAAWLAYWSGARERVGYATEGRSALLTRAVPWGREAQHRARPQAYLDLAAAAGAKAKGAQTWEFSLRPTPQELARARALLGNPGRGRRIGLAPGSVASSRRWPEDRYAALADRLAAAGHQVFLLGGAGDVPIAERVAQKTKRPPKVLAGTTSLREAISVTRCLDLVVSNDSGAMHLAYAQGVPVLVLQGAADPKVTGPFGPAGRVLRADGPECAPCVRNDCERQDLACMTGITVEMAWAEVRKMLGAKHGRKV
jgi:heptosyltransferase II